MSDQDEQDIENQIDQMLNEASFESPTVNAGNAPIDGQIDQMIQSAAPKLDPEALADACEQLAKIDDAMAASAEGVQSAYEASEIGGRRHVREDEPPVARQIASFDVPVEDASSNQEETGNSTIMAHIPEAEEDDEFDPLAGDFEDVAEVTGQVLVSDESSLKVGESPVALASQTIEESIPPAPDMVTTEDKGTADSVAAEMDADASLHAQPVETQVAAPEPSEPAESVKEPAAPPEPSAVEPVEAQNEPVTAGEPVWKRLATILILILAPLNLPIQGASDFIKDLVGFIGITMLFFGISLLAYSVAGKFGLILAIIGLAPLTMILFVVMFIIGHKPSATGPEESS